MNIKIANALGGYFEALYNVNVKLIKLCGIDILNSYENDECLVFDIIQDIFRLFPCKYDKTKNKLILDSNGGLLEFEDSFEFLKDDFTFLLDKKIVFINELRQIRNKYEHKMHSAKIVGQDSSSLEIFDFEFVVENTKIILHSCDFIELITILNAIYEKIQNEVYCFAQTCDKTEYFYYRRLTKFGFGDFSKIYNDINLRLIGKLMHTF